MSYSNIIWLRHYYKAYFKKVGEGTFSFLKKRIVIPILILVIPAILGVFVANDGLSKIIIPVCYGFGSSLILIISVFFYNLLHTHASIFKEDQETIELLKKENQKLKATMAETISIKKVFGEQEKEIINTTVEEILEYKIKH